MHGTAITSHSVRQRSALPGRERWEVPSLLKNPELAQIIENHLSAHKHMLKVIANPLSGRVLAIFLPHHFAPGEIGTMISALLPDPLAANPLDTNPLETDPLKVADKPKSFRSAKENFAQRAQSNALYQLIQVTESDPELRKKAIKLSMSHAVYKLLSPMAIGLMVSSVLFPLQTLTKMGLSKGLQITGFGIMFAITRVAESLTLHQKNQAWSRYANETESQLVQQTYNQIQSLDISYLDQHTTDKLMSTIKTDSDIIKRFLIYAPPEIIEKFTTIALASLGILVISPVAFLMCLIPIPLITRINKQQRVATTEKYRAGATYEGEFSQSLSSNLSGLSTIKSFTAEPLESQRITTAKRQVQDNAMALDKANSYYGSLAEFTFIVSIVAPLFYGCLNVLKGTLSMQLFLIQNSLVPPMVTASTGMETSRSLYSEAKMAAARINDLLGQVPEMRNESDAIDLPAHSISGELSFNDISFGYREALVFEKLAFHVAPKAKIAFVGPTGSGKSTLIKLLLRFYALNDGSITLDGIDINDVKLRQLRQSIALVSQEPYLFNGTIYQNLLYGSPDATHSQVIEACNIAQAYDFIMAHPDGFDAQIGERGNQLSGGQRQRLSIARAVLKDAAILILDEATSAVDNETEAAIRKSVELIGQNSTVIIIAHRLSSIRYVDTIYHLKDGQITEHGSHDQLVAAGGDYAALWRLQTAEESAVESELKAPTPVMEPFNELTREQNLTQADQSLDSDTLGKAIAIAEFNISHPHEPISTIAKRDLN